jgi:hypothetical protein
MSMNRPFFTCFYCYFSLYAQYGTGPAMASMPEYGSVPSVPGPMPSSMIFKKHIYVSSLMNVDERAIFYMFLLLFQSIPTIWYWTGNGIHA